MAEENHLINKAQLVPVVIIGIGVLILAATLHIAIRMAAIDFIGVIVFCFFAIYVTFMTSVKFHSPLAITETMVFTTFDSRTEVVYDKEWNTHLGVVFVEGYNAPKRVLSKPNVETGVKGPRATLLITSSPFMIESMGNGRFLIVRGIPYECDAWEAKAFLERPSIKTALGKEISEASVYFCFSSQSLHPDEIPTEPTLIREYSAILSTWSREIGYTVDIFSEEFQRKLKVVQDFRQTPLEKLALQPKPMKEEKEEDRRE